MQIEMYLKLWAKRRGMLHVSRTSLPAHVVKKRCICEGLVNPLLHFLSNCIELYFIVANILRGNWDILLCKKITATIIYLL
jgi:hypothetical protein